MNNSPLQKTFLIAIATVLILSFCGCSPSYSYNNIVVQNESIESEFKDEISLLYSSTIQTFKRQQLPTSIEEIVVKKNNFDFFSSIEGQEDKNGKDGNSNLTFNKPDFPESKTIFEVVEEEPLFRDEFYFELTDRAFEPQKIEAVGNLNYSFTLNPIYQKQYAVVSAFEHQEITYLVEFKFCLEQEEWKLLSVEWDELYYSGQGYSELFEKAETLFETNAKIPSSVYSYCASTVYNPCGIVKVGGEQDFSTLDEITKYSSEQIGFPIETSILDNENLLYIAGFDPIATEDLGVGVVVGYFSEIDIASFENNLFITESDRNKELSREGATIKQADETKRFFDLQQQLSLYIFETFPEIKDEFDYIVLNAYKTETTGQQKVYTVVTTIVKTDSF